MIERPFIVARNLFSWAAEQGYVGVTVYIACWVFMFPVMIAICVIGGMLGWYIDKEINQESRLPNPKPGDLDYSDWANREGKYSDDYVESKNEVENSEPTITNPDYLDFAKGRENRPKPDDPDYSDWANREGKYKDDPT